MLSILFPRTCHVCGDVLRKGVKHICPKCLAKLPYTHQLVNPQNQMWQRFLALRGVVAAGALIYYKPQTAAAQLLIDIKYHGFSKLAIYLGEMLGREADRYLMLNHIDAIVPIPIHWTRKIKRGYNQTEKLAQGIKNICHKPIINLLKSRRHATQTRLSGSERRTNVSDIFYINPKTDAGNLRHIALIDDVSTTGSTLNAAASVIEKAYPNLRITILCLACTDR